MKNIKILNLADADGDLQFLARSQIMEPVFNIKDDYLKVFEKVKLINQEPPELIILTASAGEDAIAYIILSEVINGSASLCVLTFGEIGLTFEFRENLIQIILNYLPYLGIDFVRVYLAYDDEEGKELFSNLNFSKNHHNSLIMEYSLQKVKH